MKKLSILALFAVAPAIGQAQTFSFDEILNWTGAGTNEAAMLIDWQDGSTYPALVWGYRWDGTATGEQMLMAIAAADPDLMVQITSYSFGDAVTALGFNGAAYGANGPGNHYESGFSAGSPGFWAYYLGSGTSYPDWQESATGAGDRTLSDDDWDGWSWSANFNDTPPSNQPIPAPVPAPEPSALCVLALAPLALRRRAS